MKSRTHIPLPVGSFSKRLDSLVVVSGRLQWVVAPSARPGMQAAWELQQQGRAAGSWWPQFRG